MVDVFLLLAARTAVGKYLGSLAEVPAPQLGAGAITEALRRTGATPEHIEEVIFSWRAHGGLDLLGPILPCEEPLSARRVDGVRTACSTRPASTRAVGCVKWLSGDVEAWRRRGDVAGGRRTATTPEINPRIMS